MLVLCLLVIGGRYCQPVGDISCCLPCPIVSWTYGDGKFTVCSSCRVTHHSNLVHFFKGCSGRRALPAGSVLLSCRSVSSCLCRTQCSRSNLRIATTSASASHWVSVSWRQVKWRVGGTYDRLLTDMQIAFIIPLGVKPDQCYNQITPNDMHSSLSCAFTGSLLLLGGWMVVVWSMLGTILSLFGLPSF